MCQWSVHFIQDEGILASDLSEFICLIDGVKMRINVSVVCPYSEIEDRTSQKNQKRHTFASLHQALSPPKRKRKSKWSCSSDHSPNHEADVQPFI